MVVVGNIFRRLFNFQPNGNMPEEGQITENPSSAEDCHYDVKWSEEDQEYVATVKEFPSMSWLEATPDKALHGIRALVSNTLKEMDGWKKAP